MKAYEASEMCEAYILPGAQVAQVWKLRATEIEPSLSKACHTGRVLGDLGEVGRRKRNHGQLHREVALELGWVRTAGMWGAHDQVLCRHGMGPSQAPRKGESQDNSCVTVRRTLESRCHLQKGEP